MRTDQQRVVVTGLGAVSPLGNDVPSMWASLIAGRDGFVMGEGAGRVVLESLAHARARGAKI